MKVVIVGSSSALASKRLSLECVNADAIIAADGGAEHLAKLKLVPTHLIGDMDSISQETFKYFENTSEVIQYPVKKNFSDLELAFQKAEELKAESVFIFGWADHRIDYSWNCILSLSTSAKDKRFKGPFSERGRLKRGLKIPLFRLLGGFFLWFRAGEWGLRHISRGLIE